MRKTFTRALVEPRRARRTRRILGGHRFVGAANVEWASRAIQAHPAASTKRCPPEQPGGATCGISSQCRFFSQRHALPGSTESRPTGVDCSRAKGRRCALPGAGATVGAEVSPASILAPDPVADALATACRGNHHKVIILTTRSVFCSPSGRDPRGPQETATDLGPASAFPYARSHPTQNGKPVFSVMRSTKSMSKLVCYLFVYSLFFAELAHAASGTWLSNPVDNTVG